MMMPSNSTTLTLPGMPNVHSHAFQRAMAGLTEWRSSEERDTFWTWRTLMYRFAGKITPDQLRAIATWLYIEMLKGGYTHVGEFHYLHNQPDGSPYANPAELSLAVLEAAKDVGIGMTLLPVLYATSNFGGKPPHEGQKRFIHSHPDAFLKLLDSLKKPCTDQGAVLGIAPHSLRAVTPGMISLVLGGLPSIGLKGCPKHIHAAEQRKEVDDCMQWSGKRPVEWLIDNIPIDASWCFIHATHVTESEVELMAKSGAVAGLCPTTEANLGDGVFPAESFLAHGGQFAIGGDSHVSVQVNEELRQLETSQRLALQLRAVLSNEKHCGRTLWHRATRGGMQALQVPESAKAQVTLSLDHPLLSGKNDDDALDTAIFALPVLPVQEVVIGGKRVIEGGRHRLEEKAALDFKNALKALLS